jgi:hypothetical protein
LAVLSMSVACGIAAWIVRRESVALRWRKASEVTLAASALFTLLSVMKLFGWSLNVVSAFFESWRQIALIAALTSLVVALKLWAQRPAQPLPNQGNSPIESVPAQPGLIRLCWRGLRRVWRYVFGYKGYGKVHSYIQWGQRDGLVYLKSAGKCRCLHPERHETPREKIVPTV